MMMKKKKKEKWSNKTTKMIIQWTAKYIWTINTIDTKNQSEYKRKKKRKKKSGNDDGH